MKDSKTGLNCGHYYDHGNPLCLGPPGCEDWIAECKKGPSYRGNVSRLDNENAKLSIPSHYLSCARFYEKGYEGDVPNECEKYDATFSEPAHALFCARFYEMGYKGEVPHQCQKYDPNSNKNLTERDMSIETADEHHPNPYHALFCAQFYEMGYKGEVPQVCEKYDATSRETAHTLLCARFYEMGYEGEVPQQCAKYDPNTNETPTERDVSIETASEDHPKPLRALYCAQFFNGLKPSAEVPDVCKGHDDYYKTLPSDPEAMHMKINPTGDPVIHALYCEHYYDHREGAGTVPPGCPTPTPGSHANVKLQLSCMLADCTDPSIPVDEKPTYCFDPIAYDIEE